MADIIEHIWQAQHNEEFAHFILNTEPKYRDWAVTAAFYAAIHWAEACFTTLPTQTGNDERSELSEVNAHRLRAIKVQDAVSDAVYRKYKKLQNACWNVRYLGQGPWQRLYTLTDVQGLVNTVPAIRTELLKAFHVKLP